MESKKRRFRGQMGVLTALIACGVAVNFLGVRIALAFDWPVFLDSIGTILSAALGGYIPGIIVGFITNLVNGIFDYTTAYYASISVLLAVCAAQFSKQRAFSCFPKVLLTVPAFALIGGGIGSVLTWCLFGGGIGTGISASLAMRILGTGTMGAFFSQLSADLLIDLLDKAITVCIVAAVLHVVPEGLRERLAFPRDDLPKMEGGETKTRKASLQTKVLSLVAASILLIAVVVTSVSGMLFRNAIIEEQSRMAEGVAHTALSVLEPEKEMLTGEQAGDSEVKEVLQMRLADIVESSEDIASIYVFCVGSDGIQVLFNTEASARGEMEAESVLPFLVSAPTSAKAVLGGEAVPPFVSDEGGTLTVLLQAQEEDGIWCVVGVDLSLTRLNQDGMIFLARIISLFMGFFTIILAAGMAVAEYGLIRPINAMAKATSDFASEGGMSREDSLSALRALNISTGDEVENLYTAIVSTTGEVVETVEKLQKRNEQIARLQNGLIMVLADLVESRDKSTGSHIKHTAMYVRLIMEKMRELGMYTDKLTPEYIEEVVGAAPLHDVGKIHITDSILNKPGKLLDEEYALMKTHASVGGDIIDRVKEIVADESGYLEEAHNMTQYHHERWDGKGYPAGLAGEEIPLSARIMAVADVFDALVSKRSYKEGFPFEKSIEIIQEGSGTQFDPQVVEAFLQCEAEVRRLAAESGES